MKEKLLKLFIIILVCMSLSSGPLAQKEISKMLECVSGVRDAKIEELDEVEEETGEPKVP